MLRKRVKTLEETVNKLGNDAMCNEKILKRLNEEVGHLWDRIDMIQEFLGVETKTIPATPRIVVLAKVKKTRTGSLAK